MAGHHATLDFSRVERIEPFGAQVLGMRLRRLGARGVQLELKGLTAPTAVGSSPAGALDAPHVPNAGGSPS